MTREAFLSRFEGVRSRGSGKYLALCPAHSDKNPSLSIREAEQKILVKCWAGCETLQIVAALGLTMADLFSDSPPSPGQRLTPTPRKLDLSAVAHRFELAALDRRLRAEQVLRAVATMSDEEMEDEQRDRLMKAVARAYDDQNRADFLEAVADGLRVKAYQERMACHAA
jgi:hypothetical protein